MSCTQLTACSPAHSKSCCLQRRSASTTTQSERSTSRFVSNRAIRWAIAGAVGSAATTDNTNRRSPSFSEAIRLDSSSFVAYDARGDAWRHQRDFANAIADFTTAIALNPESTRTYWLRGLCRNELGDCTRRSSTSTKLSDVIVGLDPLTLVEDFPTSKIRTSIGASLTLARRSGARRNLPSAMLERHRLAREGRPGQCDKGFYIRTGNRPQFCAGLPQQRRSLVRRWKVRPSG